MLEQKGKSGVDAQLMYRIPLNTTIGLLMSVRAFGCESVYGLKLLTLSANEDKLAVEIPLAWANSFCMKLRFDGIKEDAEVDKSLSTSSSAQKFPFHAGEPTPTAKQSRVW